MCIFGHFTDKTWDEIFATEQKADQVNFTNLRAALQ